MWQTEANKVMAGLQEDYKVLKNSFDNMEMVGAYESKAFKALCYEMCTVETKISGLIESAKLHEKQLRTDLEESKIKQLLDSVTAKLRKVGA